MSRMASNGSVRGYGQKGYHSDQASYFTETSSVTNPPELLGIVEDEDYDDAVSYITETSALTGWTTENSAAIPSRQPRSMKLDAITESGSEEESRNSANSSFGDGVSAFNDFESVGVSLAASNYHPNNAVIKAGRCLSPRSSASARSNRLHQKSTFRSDDSSLLSNASKKRDPVPQMRNPEMDDTDEEMWEAECNCDINPTPLYEVIISRDWKHVTDLLDGKEEDPVWSLPGLTGIHQLMPTLGVNKQDSTKMKDYQMKLRSQARTWIVNRERGSGVLKWRMLPIHVALSYQAPFEVVERLYELYPGSVRCRDHRGMLPLHICFYRGGEDRVLELFLDVFPDALDVKDDKGRNAIECTPEDGSENERRSNIMRMFLDYSMEKQEMIRLQEKVKMMHKPVTMTQEPASLGPTTSSTFQESNKLDVQTNVEPEDDDEIPDKYSLGDVENSSKMNDNRNGGGLDENIEVLQSEFMAFGMNKKKTTKTTTKKKGMRKIFGKKNVPYN